MSSENHLDDLEPSNIHIFPISHARDIRADLAALRRSVTVAWQERGVMLTREEQEALQAEIKDLCHYLRDLTGSRE